eukprot:scaffold53801_cov67-Phaeocystis_antarctica.AAC.1
MGELGFHCWGVGQRRRPLEVRSRLPELRCRARLNVPSVNAPAQHSSPHVARCLMVRRRPHNPRRQRLESLKALSTRVVRAAPNDQATNSMRGAVLCGRCSAWEVGPRSTAELTEAAAHLDRAGALHTAPAAKAEFAHLAGSCRNQAMAM